MGSPSPSMNTATCTDRWVVAEEEEGQELGGKKRVQRVWESRGNKHKEPILRELDQEEKRIPAMGVDAPSPAPIPSLCTGDFGGAGACALLWFCEGQHCVRAEELQ